MQHNYQIPTRQTKPVPRKVNLSPYEEGCRQLSQARNEKFAVPLTLHKAFQSFCQAIAQTPCLVEPYLSLGYLCLIVGDIPAAQFILTEAEQISPEHPDMQALLAHLKKESLGKTNRSRCLDMDELYEQVETLILKQTHYFLRANPQTLKAGKLQKVLKHIQAYIHLLEDDIDTLDLQQKMTPMNTLCKRQSVNTAFQNQILAIQAEIKQQIQIAQNFIELLKNSVDDINIDQPLENLLDQCDLIADQIDEMSEKGQSDSTLEANYRVLIKNVTQLQDLLDQA